MKFSLRLCSIFMVCILFLDLSGRVIGSSSEISLESSSTNNDEEKEASKGFELNENQKKILDDDEAVKSMLENLKFLLIVSKSAQDLKEKSKRSNIKRRQHSNILRFNPQTSNKKISNLYFI